MQYVSKQTLVALLGKEPTDALLEEFGGLYIHIPMRADTSRGQRFVDTIGGPSFDALRKAYGGENISLPIPEREYMKERIIPLIEQGWSYNAIAKEVGCHWRHVAGIKQDIARKKKLKKKKLFKLLLPISVEGVE